MDKIEAARYALVSEGVVVNVVLWDGDTRTWSPPEGTVAVKCSDEVGVGWTFIRDEWSAPEVPA